MKKLLMIVLVTGSSVLPVLAGSGEIYSMLQSTIPSVRRNAVMRISSTRDTEWVNTLGSLVQNDPHFTVRAAAAEALGNIRSREATPHLLSAIRDPNRSVRASAIVSMGYVRDRDAVEGLMAYVRSEEDQGLVVSALNVLGVIGDARAVPLLEESLGSGSSRIRQISAQSLGRLRSAGSVDRLLGMLGDSDRSARLQAVRALGEIGSETAVRPLARYLRREDDIELKIAAAHSLGQLGQDEGYSIVLQAARSGDHPDTIRRSALRALAAIGKRTPEVEAVLLEAYNSGNEAVRRDAEFTASFLDIEIPSTP